MSLRPRTIITFEQQPNDLYPGNVRNKTYILDFVHSGEITSSWINLTDIAKIKIPRNVFVESATVDQLGRPNLTPLGGPIRGAGDNLAAGNIPVFMRGDKVTISLGYYYAFNTGSPNQFNVKYGNQEQLIMDTDNGGAPSFVGYITKIKNHVPIEIDCEDEMWLLKKIRCPNKVFKGSEYDVADILRELLNGDRHLNTPYKVVDGTDFSIKCNIGDFRTQNETVAQVLERLKKDGGIYCYFRNGELRASGVVYYPQDRRGDDPSNGLPANIFSFRTQLQPGTGLIISDTLEYTRKEDLSLAVKAHAQYFSNGDNGTNSDGTPKTKRKRVEVLVTVTDPAKGTVSVIPKELASSFHGDLITLPVLIKNNIPDSQIQNYVVQKAEEYLRKFYYTGFRGDFETFGQPQLRHGDAVITNDNVLPERNGTYLIKQVHTTFGINGIKQKVTVHLRIDTGFTVQQINAGL